VRNRFAFAAYAAACSGSRRVNSSATMFAARRQASVDCHQWGSIVASAFSPALAPVGVLLAVFGYALGTYGAWVCGQLMRLAAGG